jgi:hypothetical protein
VKCYCKVGIVWDEDSQIYKLDNVKPCDKDASKTYTFLYVKNTSIDLCLEHFLAFEKFSGFLKDICC